jgi:hypothetical protein
MRKSYIFAIVLVLVAQSGRIGAQTDPRAPGALYLRAVSQINITMSKGAAVIGAMSFPQGTQVSVRAIGQQPQMTSPGRYEFHGNIELRAMPGANIPASAFGRPAAEVLAQAPMVLAAQGVDLLVEQVQ